jgi:hypothetical protein
VKKTQIVPAALSAVQEFRVGAARDRAAPLFPAVTGKTLDYVAVLAHFFFYSFFCSE